MQQTEIQLKAERIIEFISSLMERLNQKTITPSDIPSKKLQDLIYNSLQSNISYLDPSQTFRNSISVNMGFLETAIQQNNIEVCCQQLQFIALQISVFSTLEASWICTFNINRITMEHDLHAYKEYVESILPTLSTSNMFKGKGVIYTAITGGYDNLQDPDYIIPNIDYICFTDNHNLQSNVWQINYIDNPDNLDSIRLARKHKILAHHFLSDYDYSIWVDGKIHILDDITTLPNLYHRNSPLLCMPHYERNCIYDEATACLSANKGNPEEIIKQINRYQEEGYPKQNKLIDSCVLFRIHNNERVKELMEAWWNEVLHESTRDQLSFNYACWKNQFSYDLCPLNVQINPYFEECSHN